jgi:hypothetical protein
MPELLRIEAMIMPGWGESSGGRGRVRGKEYLGKGEMTKVEEREPDLAIR